MAKAGTTAGTTRRPSKPGVQLRQAGLVDQGHLSKLSALSVTTVEELLSLAQEAPIFMKSFLEGTNMDDLLNEASGMATMTISAQELQELRETTYSFGSIPPSVQVSEEEATLYFDTIESPTAGIQLEADLGDCFGPIRDQGSRGTCVAQAVTAMRECLWKRSEGSDEDLSEQHLYWLCKMNDGSPTEDGTFQRVAVPMITQFGQCRESTWPYNPAMIAGDISQGPPPTAAKQEGLTYKVRQGLAYSPRSVIDIQQRLSEGYPVAVSVPVYPIGGSSTFELPIVKKTGDIIMPIPGTVRKAGHAVCLTGYAFDSTYAGGGFFIVRNSWGKRWGTNSPFGAGYGTIPFNYIGHYCWEAYSLQS